MTIEEALVKQYGPLLSLTELAKILDRSPEGLRISLRSSGECRARTGRVLPALRRTVTAGARTRSARPLPRAV